ncbi:aspartate/glutamate racemase family protein [Elioraea tepida]|jgi:Asp/Glu/hydantoin racemase|uniref:Aspartate/glutamate racemase family protein n=1 Tax=Elioraea tepida TaxID=2843330 RepID=A0A975U027_9PROT|nr:aspartate/glutamate racemase family protein [Elioraea tepida]QXM23825.1 aspartate/glutamate racemase family protein [Elioraea tepida]
MARPRLALIHALRHSPAPIAEAFARLWPEPFLMNLFDDSLSADLARDGRLTPSMTARFLELAAYARRTGAVAILFTCSAFGPCIDAVKAQHPDIPVLKPNEAMIDEALEAAPSGRIGVLATFPATLASIRPEFEEAAARRGAPLSLVEVCAPEALAALDAGDAEAHDRHAAAAAAALAGCEVVALAQVSLARAAAAIAAATGRPVLTTPDSAVLRLRSLLA